MNARRFTQEELLAEIQNWNQKFPIGTEVKSEIYPDGVYKTRTEAVALFDQKPVIYLDGFNGYFDLDEIHPVTNDEAFVPTATQPTREKIVVVFPGQGAQAKGMGKDLFGAYPDQTDAASEILGYSISELCLEDPNDQLNQTQFTQPALYVVNALGHRRLVEDGAIPDTVDAYAGHSLGEYNALHAAGAFDFETGLRLVVERGRLMSQANGGGMAAVVGLDAVELRAALDDADLQSIDLANFNTPTQIVISGPAAAVDAAVKMLRKRKVTVVPLKVSAAFHSRHMQGAQKEFADFLSAFTFDAPKAQVIANATALPYEPDAIADTLSRQIASPVLWSDSIGALLRQGETRFIEVGSKILTNMIDNIKKAAK